jgi:hypothetical protein
MTWKNDNRLALFTGLAEQGGKMLFFQLSYHIQTAEYVCLRTAARYYGASSRREIISPGCALPEKQPIEQKSTHPGYSPMQYMWLLSSTVSATIPREQPISRL